MERDHTDASDNGNRIVAREDMDRFLRKLAELPPVREEVVSRIRTEMDSGRYMTLDKVETAIDRLYEDL